MGVQNKDGALYWATGIDNSGMKQDADEAKGIIKGMSDDILKTADSTTSAIDKIGQDAIKSAQKQLTEQQLIVKQIEQDIRGLEKSALSSKNTKDKDVFVSEINAAKQALAEEKAILSELDAKVNGVADKHVMLRTQISKAKDELAQMEMAGKRGSVEYDVLAKKLGDLNDQFKDTAAVATILANDQRGFQAVTQGVSGMAGAMSAATGIASLFGAENENLAKVQMRLQAVMAITIGLQQVAETLNKDSYFSVVLIAKAKQMWAVNELKLATALGISTTAARASMVAMAGLATAGIGIAVIALVAFIDKQQEAIKTSNELNLKMSEAASKPIVAYKKLQSQWNDLGDDIQAKNKFVKDNKDNFHELGIEVTKLSEAENVLVKNTKVFEQAMIARAKAAAASEIAQEKFKKVLQKQMEVDKMPDNLSITTSSGGVYGITTEKMKGNYKKDNAKKELAELNTEAEKYIKMTEDETKKFNSLLKETGVKPFEDIKKETKKAVKEAYDATKDLKDLLLDINQQTSSLLLEQQKDSLQKRLAAIDLEKEAELQKIREKEAAIVEEYNKSNKNKKGFTPLSTNQGDLQNSLKTINPDLANSLQTATSGITEAFGKKSVEETRKWNEEVMDLARSFADKRIQLAYDYNKDIAKLEAEGQFKAAKLARVERDKAISDETAQMIENTSLFKTITDEKLNISKQATDALLDNIRNQLAAEWAAGKLTVKQMNELMDQVNQAQEKVGARKSENNPFAQLGTAIGNRKTANADLKAAKLDPSKTAEDIAKLESKAKDAGKAIASAAGSALMGAQDILGSVVGGLDQLGMLTDQQKKDAENVMGMLNGASDIAMGIASGNPMQIIQGSIDLVVNAFTLFDKKSREAAREIEKQQKNIDRLKESYEELEKAVDKAFSSTKAGLINQEIANLEAQNSAMQKQIAAEKSKKKSDSGTIKEWEQSIKDNKNTIEELRDSWIEALTGTDVMSAIDSLAQAYADVWSNGNSSAKASTDYVKGLLKNALINYMKSQLQPEVDGLMKSIANAMQDGSISQSEQSAIDALTSAMDKKAEQYKAALDPYLENNKSGATGELKAAMTEGTGSQLVGLWNMTAMDIRWIRDWIAAQSGISVPETKIDITKMINDINAIQTNTRETADNTNGLKEALAELKEELIAIKNGNKTSRL